jgi:hypothetical protein
VRPRWHRSFSAVPKAGRRRENRRPLPRRLLRAHQIPLGDIATNHVT